MLKFLKTNLSKVANIMFVKIPNKINLNEFGFQIEFKQYVQQNVRIRPHFKKPKFLSKVSPNDQRDYFLIVHDKNIAKKELKKLAKEWASSHNVEVFFCLPFKISQFI